MTGATNDGAVVRKDVVRNRARILAAADTLVADRGMDISFNELAHRAGVGVGTVYRHFADRDAIVDAMFENRVQQIEQILTGATLVDDPREAFVQAMYGVCELQSGDRGIFQALVTSRRREHRAAVHERIEPVMTVLVERAKEAGVLRADVQPTDVPVVLRMIGGVSDFTDGGHPDLWRRYLRILLAGMGVRDLDRLEPAALSTSQLDDVLDELARKSGDV